MTINNQMCTFEAVKGSIMRGSSHCLSLLILFITFCENLKLKNKKYLVESDKNKKYIIETKPRSHNMYYHQGEIVKRPSENFVKSHLEKVKPSTSNISSQMLEKEKKYLASKKYPASTEGVSNYTNEGKQRTGYVRLVSFSATGDQKCH